MGGGYWDSKFYSVAASARAATGTDDFAYSKTTLLAPEEEQKAHADLDPLLIKDSVNHTRESRDSVEHPETVAIGVVFDVTGSMRGVPQVFQKNLNKLMSLVMLKGKIEHPQILVGAVGDATCDRIPVQMAQFESNNLIDEHLRKIVLEGGGGEDTTESYELALYAMARLTDIDCLNKRGKRGYLFLSGDETPYPLVKHNEVKRVFGVGEQVDIPIEDIFKEVQNKYNVFFIIPKQTSHYNDPHIYKTWVKYLGQHVLKLEDPSTICELIASTIASEEGVEIEESLKDAGVPARTRKKKKTLVAAE